MKDILRKSTSHETSIETPLVSHILIIDDHTENLIALENILEKEDRYFLKALSGKEGIDLAQQHDISLILLDVQMPEMNGFEVAEALQSNDLTSHIPIIFVTGMSRELKYALRGFREGAVDYLAKPVNPDLVRAKVSVFLKLERQRREILSQYKQLEKLGLMVKNSVDMMAILDQRKLAFEEINPAFTKTLGYQPEDLIGEKITQLFCELKDVIKFEKQLNTYQQQDQEIMHYEIKVNGFDGQEKWLSINVAETAGKWFLNARDITREKSLQQKLLQSNEDLEQFAQIVAYELKDPINMMDQYLKLLGRDHSEERSQQYAKYLSKNLPRTKQLMDDLLYYARITDGDERKRVSVTTLLQNVIGNLGRIIDQSDADIRVGTLPDIICMPSQIEILFRNLINNALKFCEETTPKIIIQCKELPEFWEFSINDNGIGMNMKYAQVLFGYYEGAIILNKPKIRGIGLKICDKIVKKHGGKMRVNSTPGKGSTFYFTIKK